MPIRRIAGCVAWLGMSARRSDEGESLPRLERYCDDAGNLESRGWLAQKLNVCNGSFGSHSWGIDLEVLVVCFWPQVALD